MQELNGIIVINKPKNYTSHDVVAKVKKILKLKKVGHTGTLDPNATGVLPLLLNSGTKLSKYLINHDKEYEVNYKYAGQKLLLRYSPDLSKIYSVDRRNGELEEIKLLDKKANSTFHRTSFKMSGGN